MKAIIFDVDGVIIKSESQKKKTIQKILQKYDLWDIPGVSDVLGLGLNRKVLISRIHELKPFDTEAVLKDIDDENAIIESNPVKNENVVDFIQDNCKEYLFFTNTSLPIYGLQRVVDSLGIRDNFRELLAFESGSKIENIYSVMNDYHLKPRDILFVDDNINHVNAVKETGVHVLHFTDYDFDIKKYLADLKSS